MGRGSYFGGSTLIRPGSSWFSYRKPSKKVPNVRGKIDGFFHSVVLAEVYGSSPPDVPEELEPVIGDQVRRAGGVFRWAQRSKKYAEARRKKLRKLKKQEQTRIAKRPAIIGKAKWDPKPPKIPKLVAARPSGYELWSLDLKLRHHRRALTRADEVAAAHRKALSLRGADAGFHQRSISKAEAASVEHRIAIDRIKKEYRKEVECRSAARAELARKKR